MEHDEISARIADLDDRELPQVQRAALQAHLDSCAACRGSLAAWRAGRRVFFAPPTPPTRAQTEAFTRAVLARLEAPAPRFDWRTLLVPAFGLALAAAAFALTPSRDAGPLETLLQQDQGLYAFASQPAPEGPDDVLSFATEGR